MHTCFAGEPENSKSSEKMPTDDLCLNTIRKLNELSWNDELSVENAIKKNRVTQTQRECEYLRSDLLHTNHSLVVLFLFIAFKY